MPRRSSDQPDAIIQMEGPIDVLPPPQPLTPAAPLTISHYTINFPIDPAVALTASNHLQSRYCVTTHQDLSRRPYH